MNRIIYLLIFLFSIVHTQTFFTIPRSVWRISIINSIGSGNWIGSGGIFNKGVRDISYMANDSTVAAFVHQLNKMNYNKRVIHIEYGLSEKMTFSLFLPSYKSLNNEISWSKDIVVDSLSSSLDSLLNLYYPNKRSTSGLGDASLGMKILLYGHPSWTGKEPISIYGGVSLQLPTAKKLGSYKTKLKNDNGVPHQVFDLPVGNGMTRYSYSLFGEFFKYFNKRLVNITWRIEQGKYSRELVNTPVSFLWGSETNPDSIISKIGNSFLHQLGDEFLLSAMGKLELFPDRLSITAGINSIRTERDFVLSENSNWDNWMVTRMKDGEIIHDTKKTQVRQYILATFHNVHPIKSFGPVLFDIEIGASFPYFTRHTYTFANTWIGLQAYFQAW
ncbi:MAG: hypothetical protein QGI18_01430 [Candidatus Marinimicrobia bacterium]|mgnify:FL=1|nr:hypothetical protein [Candidatus Neomarinimicrobiota bacterium]